ncbi:hypothetical protein NL676_019537 [Syzygium grande]|nr:hypothetical protein NL676_019537 [Syzygium grande]
MISENGKDGDIFPPKTTTKAEHEAELRNRTRLPINAIEGSRMISSCNPIEEAKTREVAGDLTWGCMSRCGREESRRFYPQGLSRFGTSRQTRDALCVRAGEDEEAALASSLPIPSLSRLPAWEPSGFLCPAF